MSYKRQNKAPTKSEITRHQNEHRRNTQLERAIDDNLSTALTTISEFERYLRANEQELSHFLYNYFSGDLMAFHRKLATWAGCYVKWTGQRVQRVGGDNDKDWDFGDKAYPLNVLIVIVKYWQAEA